MPTLFLSRATAAVSVAVINSIGNLGGLVGPYFIGLIKGWAGRAAGGLIFLAALVFISFAMMALMRLGTGRDEVTEPAWRGVTDDGTHARNHHHQVLRIVSRRRPPSSGGGRR